MEVYVIRHTRVAIDKDTCYGRAEVPLADTFLAEVAALQARLPTDFAAVYCSPLARCLALAQALGYPGCPLVPALAEMDFGDWEGKKWNDIEQGALNHWMLDFVGQKPPNGENLREVFARTSHFLTHLAQQDHQKVLLITYAGPIRCIWAFLLEIRLANVFKLPVGYGEVLGFHLATDQTHCRIWQMK